MAKFTKLLITVTIALCLVAPMPALAATAADSSSAVASGLKYLANNQQTDGSISGFGGESEWTAIALQAAGQQAASFTNGGSSLLDYLKTDTASSTTSATTIERDILALTATGQDPADFGGVNYEALLATKYTGGQIGDPTLLNDDIFGIIAIDAAQDKGLVPEAQDALNYLLAHQAADGGFSYTTSTCSYCGSDSNDTAAAIVAMYAASDLGLGSTTVDAAQSKALVYLLGTQQADGGFGYDQSSESDGGSTAWALMALNAIGSSVSSSAASARGWLLKDQNADGGFSYGAYGTTTSDTYTTPNAIIALLGTTWLLKPAPTATVSKPPASGSTTNGAVGSTSTPPPKPPARTQATSNKPAVTPVPSVNGTEPQPASSPKVEAAKTTVPSSGKAAPDLVSSNKSRSYNLYYLALLGSIALMWFVLESRKTGEINEN